MADHEQRTVEFARALRQARSRLFGYIHALVRNLDDTDDLFQQTTLILWNKFDEFDRSRSFLSWACGVARLEVCNFLRSRGRQRLYFSDDLNLLLAEAQEDMSHDEMEERRLALAGCVEKLRQRDRQLLDECYGQDDGVTQVAGRHGRSPQSVHNSLRRIRRSLYECIRRTLDQQSRPGLIG